ncbi:suppressor of fused domain protein [Dermacoccaceae bacterium W4C1]
MTDLPPTIEPDDAIGRVAPRNTARRTAYVAHLRSFLGPEIQVLSEKVSIGINLDLYVFPVTPERPFVTLVTFGMSDLPSPDLGLLSELLIAVPAGWPGIDPLDGELLKDPANFWPINLLKDVARIPAVSGKSVTWGHSIADVEGELFRAAPQFAGSVIGPPAGLPPQLMVAETPDGTVETLAVIPITAPEMEYKVSLPGGGDSLIDRFFDAGVSVVVAPDRQDVATPPPYAAHVLMRHRAEDLGRAVAHATPNWAQALSDDRRHEAVFPDEDNPVRLRVSGSIAPAAVHRDPLLLVTDAGRSAIEEHQGVLTVLPEVGGDGVQATRLLSWVSMMFESEDALAVWLPHQGRVLTRDEFETAIDREPVVLASLVRTSTPEGHPAVITRGMAALGGTEVWSSEANGWTHEQLEKRVRSLLNKAEGEPDEVPKAGARMKYGFSWHELVPGVRPGTDEPVLVVTAARKPIGSGEATPEKEKKGGLFRRRG